MYALLSYSSIHLFTLGSGVLRLRFTGIEIIYILPFNLVFGAIYGSSVHGFTTLSVLLRLLGCL